MRHPAASERREGVDLLGRVVRALDHRILERGSSSGGVRVVDQRFSQLCKRPPAHPRHDPVAGLLHCRVERYCKCELLRLTRETLNARYDATGGDREVASADPLACGVVHQAQSAECRIVVVERLTLPHCHCIRYAGPEVAADECDLPHQLSWQ